MQIPAYPQIPNGILHKFPREFETISFPRKLMNFENIKIVITETRNINLKVLSHMINLLS